MKPLLLVDGYNIIGAWPEAYRQKWPVDECRDRLLRQIEDYAGATGEEVILVFDGYQSARRQRSEEKLSHATVVFTKQGETADQYIERQVALCPRYRPVRVATSDGLEQSQVLKGGAVRVSARELLMELNEHKRRQRERQSRQAVFKRNPLSSHLTREQVEKLERMRRGTE